jgi:hypothetical protein
LIKNGLGLHFGRFFRRLIWSPCLRWSSCHCLRHGRRDKWTTKPTVFWFVCVSQSRSTKMWKWRNVETTKYQNGKVLKHKMPKCQNN